MSGWISVKDRLPDNDDFVLVIVSGKAGNITLDNAIELAQISMDEGWIFEMWPEWEDPKVTYWTPISEPPKEDKPMTNADRIRFMSDEELAKFINDSIACDHCIHDGHCNEFDNYQKCLEGVLKRLRQPVEDTECT